MGLFDNLAKMISPSVASTPVFNPNDPGSFSGFYEPTAEERKRARAMALLQTGAGILANNSGHYGAFAPALGAGVMHGIQGYQNEMQQGPERRMKAMQQALYGQQIKASMEKAKADQEEEGIVDKRAKSMLTYLGFNPDNLENDVGGFLTVSAEPQPIRNSPLPYVGEGETPLILEDLSYSPPKPRPKFEALAKRLGWGDEDIDFLRAQAAADPKGASKFLFDSMKEYQRARLKGTKEAKDVIAKERAMADAMGIPLDQYLKQKMEKSGVNVQVVNHMAEKAAEQAGKKEGYDIGEQAAMIENKWSAVDSVREAKDMLNQGIYTGYWADVGKTLAKASMGAVGDRQKAARTEQFMSYIGNTVVPRLKEFGGNDSNEEMRYLQRIMGGDITMEPEALAAILDSAERKITRGIERLQRQRGALERGTMPDLGPGPSRSAPARPATPQARPAAPSGVRKYNPATGRIE